MIDQLLSRTNEGLVAAGVMVLLLAAAEVGFRGARRFRSMADDAGNVQLVTVQAAVFGLLALLLGFTFSMAVARFDAHRQLMVDEANAIGTAQLRAQSMAEPQRGNLARLLRQYIDLRLEFYGATADRNKLERVNATTGRLQNELWAQALQAGEKDSRAVTTGLLMAALNDVIDLHAKQLAAARNRIPPAILFLLCFVAVAAIGLTGYGSGLDGRRNFALTFLMSLLIAAVTALLLDLHRPAGGMVSVSTQSMIDLRDSIDSPAR